jgi:hypothetical protein
MAVPRITRAELKRRIDADRTPVAVHVHAQHPFASCILAPAGALRFCSSPDVFGRAATSAVHLPGTARE